MIRLILSNLPPILFVLAFVAAWARGGRRPLAERLLAWLLLLSVGVEEAWAGVFHVFFPQIASASIGWQASPFETEIGIADAAIGIVAIASFWRGIEFKAAVVWYVALFYLGVALVHLRDAAAGNLAADNFGVLLVLTLIKMVLLPALLIAARRGGAR